MSVITSLKNPYVINLVRLREDKAFRKHHRRLIVHGSKVFEELVKDNAPIKTILYTPDYKPLISI
jgi:tRNA G18 (ribose-2'-O)-methylase SpoU